MIDNIVEQSHSYSFFQAVSLLEKSCQLKYDYLGVGENKNFSQEYVQFSVSPSLGFPKSDIEMIEQWEFSGHSYTKVEVNFLGLHGSGSPLPGSYTEKLAGRDNEHNPVRHFFDFFHNRYLSLLYRIWKKYRYHVQYQSDAGDAFSANMLNLIGLSGPIQDFDAAHLDRAKLLSYVGQLSARASSPRLISGVVAHYFGLQNVEIEEWVSRRVGISHSQQNRLNRANTTLGNDCHLGASMPDLTGKFNLWIKDIDFDTYEKFKQGGELNRTITEFMRFVLRDPLAWDLKLSVKSSTLPRNSLGNGRGNALGQTIWLGKPAKDNAMISVIGSL